MGKQYLDKDGLQVAVDNVKEAKEIATGAMALAQQAMESGGGGVPTISETGSFPGQANQFPKIVTLQNNFTKLYSFHQIGIPGSGWIAGWEFEAPNTVKVYPYTVYEGNYTPLNGSIFSFNYEAIGE